jgi:mannose-1-phosphate guanylyltransferase
MSQSFLRLVSRRHLSSRKGQRSSSSTAGEATNPGISKTTLADDVIILCGGAGLRLRPVTGDGPKSMAQVAGSPFLEMPLRQLRRHGFQRVILAVGYAASAIQSHFGQSFSGMDIEYSEEAAPLGTGGALSNAAPRVKSKDCLILNGDSYTDVDLGRFAADHRESEADVSVVIVPVDGRGDAGSILLGADNQVVKFAEKERPVLGAYLNAGIYLISKEILSRIPPERPVSLETELFPLWIRQGHKIQAYIHHGNCVDIGTPERYQTAQQVLASFEVKAKCSTSKGDRE